MDTRELGLGALGTGALFLVICVPAGFAMVTLQRWFSLGEPLHVSARIGQALMPTLVFSLVLAEILRDRFAAPPWLVGGIVVYAVVNTVLPGVLMRLQAPVWDSPHLPSSLPTVPTIPTGPTGPTSPPKTEQDAAGAGAG